MEANELRIGNYVQDKSYQHEAIIQMIDNQCSVCSLEDGLCDLDLLEPIPLTEEWLVKFGFTQQGRYFNKKAKHNLFVWYENHIGIKGMLGVVKPSKCIYVHQLQNLYFALTQTELKIK